MTRRALVALIALIPLALAGAASGTWPEVRRRSPRAVATLELPAPDGATVEAVIEYGAPARGARPTFGTLIPFDQVWRAGDDEATTLTLAAPLRLGGAALEPGRYALFVVPRAPDSARPWLLLVNAIADQWGAFNHEPKRDVAQIPMTVTPLPASAERLTFRWELSTDSRGLVRLAWEGVELTVPFEVGAGAAAGTDP